MKTKIMQNIKSIILALILVLGVSYVSAGTWSNPPAGTVPPANNADTPVNVGTTSQAKNGKLTIGGSTVPTASYKLSVPGLAEFTGVVTQAFTLAGGTPGQVLTSGTGGLASWQTSSGSGGTLPSGASGQTLRHNGTDWVANSNIFNSGVNVGIGTATPSAKLNIDPQGLGGILVGNSNTGSGGYTSLALKISAQSGGYSIIEAIKSSGSAYGNLIINPSGGNVGIGTTSPSTTAKLDIRDNTLASVNWGNANPVGFLGHNGNDALVGANASVGGSLRLRAGNNDRMIFSSAIGTEATAFWLNDGGSKVGFLGYNGSDALIGASASVGGSLRLRAGNADVMIIKNTGEVDLNGHTITNGYVQGGLYGLCVVYSGSCTSSTAPVSPATCSGATCGCNSSGFTSRKTGESSSTAQFWTCIKN